jgi:acyl-CoA thioester hydrolase
MDNPAPDQPPSLPGWNFSQVIPIRFRDIDMFNHVNNAAYLTYAETARVAYYGQLTGIADPRDFDMTVARAEVNYLVPIFFGQALHVYTRVTRIGTKSLTMDHEFRDAASHDLLATVSIVIVHYDHHSGQSKPLPAHIIALIETYEGRSLRGPTPAKPEK